MEAPTTATGERPDGLFERALGTAYRYLGKRERTTAEITRRLQRDGYDAETVDRALATLHEEGSVDDQRCGGNDVHGRSSLMTALDWARHLQFSVVGATE